MEETLTIEEIEARFTPEWVLIGDPQTDEDLGLRAGKVLFHSPDQDEVCRKAAEFPPGRYALRYLGSIPEDVVLAFLNGATSSALVLANDPIALDLPAVPDLGRDGMMATEPDRRLV